MTIEPVTKLADELLITIFQYVGATNIPICQAVCGRWYNVILRHRNYLPKIHLSELRLLQSSPYESYISPGRPTDVAMRSSNSLLARIRNSLKKLREKRAATGLLYVRLVHQNRSTISDYSIEPSALRNHFQHFIIDYVEFNCLNGSALNTTLKSLTAARTQTRRVRISRCRLGRLSIASLGQYFEMEQDSLRGVSFHRCQGSYLVDDALVAKAGELDRLMVFSTAVPCTALTGATLRRFEAFTFSSVCLIRCNTKTEDIARLVQAWAENPRQNASISIDCPYYRVNATGISVAARELGVTDLVQLSNCGLIGRCKLERNGRILKVLCRDRENDHDFY
uniref:F-box domain-containing protein n=1 Tax=Plectus sambesii TaxID=2011161 RepID=A0A914W7H3_9BILA